MTENPYDSASFGACVVDLHRGLLFQNKTCRELCSRSAGGEHQCLGSLCPFAPKRSFQQEHDVHLVQGIEVGGHFFDVAHFREGTREYRFIFPLDAKINAASEQVKQHGLTNRELEIAALLVAGLSNERISDRLGVSRNTLRTHLKSIYRKLPADALNLLGEREITG